MTFTPPFFIGLGLLLVSLLASRFIAERATGLLSSEEKLKLLDSFPRLRMLGAFPLVMIVIAFWGIGYLSTNLVRPAYVGFWGSLALYFVVLHRYVFGRMREFGIGADYIAAQAKAQWVKYIGFFLFFLADTFGPLWK